MQPCMISIDTRQPWRREDYEPHIRNDTVIYSGVDYEQILRQADYIPGASFLVDGGATRSNA